MSNRKIHPKLRNLTEEEIAEWEKQLQELQRDNQNTHKVNTITQGRGWIF